MSRRLTSMTLLALLVLGGCGTSPETTFVSLSSSASLLGRAYEGPPLAIGEVELPPGHDRQKLVRRGKGARLEVYDSVQWGAPLGREVRRSIAISMSENLPKGKFILPDQPAPPNGLHVLNLVFKTLSARPIAEGRPTPERGPEGESVAEPAGVMEAEAHWTLLTQAEQKRIASGVVEDRAALAAMNPIVIAEATDAAIQDLVEALLEEMTTLDR